MAETPSAKTIRWLRDQGYRAAPVERWNHVTKTRHDVFGFGDILAFSPHLQGSILVQATAAGVSSRVKKIQELNEEGGIPSDWLKAGNQIWVVGWRKLKVKRGGKAFRWKHRLIRLVRMNGSDLYPLESDDEE